MGCDIHLYFEKKLKNGNWERIYFPECIEPNDRNYPLFTFLADVRNYSDTLIIPQFAGRGIPDDTSMPKNEDDFYIGDHSFTHAYLNEILEAPWQEYDLEVCYFYIFCEYFIPRLISFCGSLSKDEEKNIRVIIGFDN